MSLVNNVFENFKFQYRSIHLLTISALREWNSLCR